jgi:hypothetical protein
MPAGPIKRVSFDGRNYVCTGDGAANRDLGGKELEFSPNGDGATGIWIEKPHEWNMNNVVLRIREEQGDQKALQDAQDTAEPKNIVFVFAGNIAYGGKGNIVGRIAVDHMAQTATVNFAGAGKLRKQ